MNVKVFSLSILIASSGYAFIKMPGEVRRIQSHRAKQDERYTAVALEYEKAIAFLDFWILRINEGLSLLSQLIQDGTFCNKALILQNKISNFTHDKLKEGANVEDLHPLMPILEEIEKLYKEYKCASLDESWSMFIHHFRVELEYAVDLLSNLDYCQVTTVQFLNRLNIEHIWMLKKLIYKHHQESLISQAYHLMCQAKNWPCDSNLLDNTLRVLPEFYDFFELIHYRISKGVLRATIPSSLVAKFVDHSVQVAKYTQKTFEAIKKGK